MTQQIAVGTVPTDDGTGLVISVQIKEGENVTVLYTGTHPASAAALGMQTLQGATFLQGVTHEEEEPEEEPTFYITRFFRDPRNPTQVIRRGLTLEDVQEHCSDPESSSDTATSPEAQARTAQFGPWFDGFNKE